MTSESIKSSAGRGNPEPHAAQIGEKLGKNSGFPIIEPEDFADAIELQTRIIANADIARVGPSKCWGG
ncbi:hypothetical protein RPMA_19145 [Tardiphaga alba]|uniref:Uncharacterized protein n=1 Tax=Tardiphaga alba TaxID=340268 RepID=A0ABX8AB50_9BRAD|nr:hypothetical protein [Tardiphaga alba]QUS40712.1 hypothetical protein RPMA_19145 [Tardiphaga alba]